MTLVVIGLAVGVAGALARVVTRLLFGMSAIDPITFGGGTTQPSGRRLQYRASVIVFTYRSDRQRSADF
jgi:hypothetical protein